MLGVCELVMNVVSGEVRHWLVHRETQRLIRGTARNWVRERESLSLVLRRSVQPIYEWFLKQNGTRTGPVQAKRRIGHLVKQIQIFHRRVVDPIRRADTGLSRPAEDFSQHSFAEAGRIGEADARTEIVVSRRGKRLGNAWITRKDEPFGGFRKNL